MVQMRWEDWREAHPGTLVLDPDTGFQDRYRKRAAIGGAGLGPAFEATLLNRDERLAENEIVLGVVHEGEARAYPMETFPAGPAALNDELGDQAIVVLSDRGSGQAMAFQRVAGGETLTFSSAGRSGPRPARRDLVAGWGLPGRVVSGRAARFRHLVCDRVVRLGGLPPRDHGLHAVGPSPAEPDAVSLRRTGADCVGPGPLGAPSWQAPTNLHGLPCPRQANFRHWRPSIHTRTGSRPGPADTPQGNL